MVSLSDNPLLKSCTQVVLVNSADSYAIVVQIPPRVLHTSSPRELRRFLCYRCPAPSSSPAPRVLLVNSAVSCAIVVQLPPQVLHTSKLVLVNSADSLYRFLLPIPLLRTLINPSKQRLQDVICNIQIPPNNSCTKISFGGQSMSPFFCFAASDVNHHFRDMGPGDRVLRYPMRWRHMEPNCDVIYIKSVDMLSRATNRHLRR
jgi:hypothetical protein